MGTDPSAESFLLGCAGVRWSGTNYTQLGSGTKLLERGWTLSFPGVAHGQGWVWGYSGPSAERLRVGVDLS